MSTNPMSFICKKENINLSFSATDFAPGDGPALLSTLLTRNCGTFLSRDVPVRLRYWRNVIESRVHLHCCLGTSLQTCLGTLEQDSLLTVLHSCLGTVWHCCWFTVLEVTCRQQEDNILHNSLHLHCCLGTCLQPPLDPPVL